ncbi:MAG: glycerophosphodiester phosphodiesterase [Myxococcales bacterium]|nr:glycerophosphodiester phosphodiesterase [Myxococcales bacterium]
MTTLPIALACSSSAPDAGAPTSPPAITRPRLVAHRGASLVAPENTLAAFRAAWALGVEAVELDVRVTRDGAVVVIHDDTTARVAGVDRAVADQTLAELRALDVGAWRGAAFAGERIPTLTEALAIVPAGATLFVELKTTAADAPTVAAVIRADPRGGQVALQAFDPDALAALAGALPGAPAYLTVGPPRADDDRVLPYPIEVLDAARSRGFAGLALDARAVTPELVVAARAAGVALDVWTVNDAAALRAWLRADVRFVETDRPELVE